MGLATSVETIDDRLADPLGTIAIQSSETGPERVLQVRNDLVSAGAFEFAIRERAARLATLRHPSCCPFGASRARQGDRHAYQSSAIIRRPYLFAKS